jgi:hypothetical protein
VLGVLLQETEIYTLVDGSVEHLAAGVASLGNMMGAFGNNDASETSHAFIGADRSGWFSRKSTGNVRKFRLSPVSPRFPYLSPVCRTRLDVGNGEGTMLFRTWAFWREILAVDLNSPYFFVTAEIILD